MTSFLYNIQQFEDLIELVKSEILLNYTDLSNLNFIMDVMMPEVCILIKYRMFKDSWYPTLLNWLTFGTFHQ